MLGVQKKKNTVDLLIADLVATESVAVSLTGSYACECYVLRERMHADLTIQTVWEQ